MDTIKGPPTRDAMVRRGRVRDVGGRLPRHVAIDATVLAILLAAVGLGNLAALLLVAIQAAVAEKADARVLARRRVRVMAGDATEPPAAGLEAAAELHLLDVIDRVRIVQVGFHEDIPEFVERQA